MSNDVKTVYKSTHQTVLDYWDHIHDEQTAYPKRVREYAERHGMGPSVYYFGSRVHSFEWTESLDDIPNGWRHNTQESTSTVTLVTPNLRTKIGKQIRQELDSLGKIPSTSGCPGLPHTVFYKNEAGVSFFEGPRLKKIGDVIYTRFRAAAVEVDEEIWQQIKLSEYYLAVENEVDE